MRCFVELPSASLHLMFVQAAMSGARAADDRPMKMRTPGQGQGRQSLNGAHYALDYGHYFSLYASSPLPTHVKT